jgi:hypothetical protein
MPSTNDPWTIRLVTACLGVVALGVIGLGAFRSLPAEVLSLGGVAVGALAGLLASVRVNAAGTAQTDREVPPTART